VPVKRFRSLQDAEDTLLLDPQDPELWARIAGLWELSRRLFPRSLPPGVYKHRTISELNSQREEWEAEAIQRGGGSG
jgi:hypothetical protein